MQLHYFPDLPVADRKENFTEIQPQLLKESDRKIRPTRSCANVKKDARNTFTGQSATLSDF